MISAEPEAPISARGERRKAESRQRLMAAARRLFIERGYHATRPQDIARAADVGHGTFYLHFKDKRHCFFAFAEAAGAELEATVGARLAGVQGMEPQLRAMLEALIDYDEHHPGLLRAAMTDVSVIGSTGAPETSLVERWAAEWAARIAAGASAGVIHGDYDTNVAGHAIVGLIRGAAGSAVRRRAGRAEPVNTMVRFLGRALIRDGAQERARRHDLMDERANA